MYCVIHSPFNFTSKIWINLSLELTSKSTPFRTMLIKQYSKVFSNQKKKEKQNLFFESCFGGLKSFKYFTYELQNILIYINVLNHIYIYMNRVNRLQFNFFKGSIYFVYYTLHIWNSTKRISISNHSVVNARLVAFLIEWNMK